MGDSETVVAHTSSMSGFVAAGYNSSTGYADESSNVASADEISTSTASTIAAFSADDGSNASEKNDYNSLMQASEATTGVEAMDSSQATGYDTSVNGTAENGTVTDNLGGAMDAQQYVDGTAMSSEEERLWNIVKANSLDFNAWTALIEETEKVTENNILKIRKVYDAFLAEFPLCYGYWKKYADHEAHSGSIDKVVEVYERAVQGVTYSVDIWLHYCIFAISTYGDPETVRRFFERALAYVGTDYLSFPLWDKYIEYEYMQQDWSQLAMIYTRILENPNQQLDRYFNSTHDFFYGEEVHTDGADPSVKAGSTDAEELEKYIAVREEMYKKAKEFDSKIIGFETAIRRPYFHVRPLNVAELENWHNYLDFIEREGDLNKARRVPLSYLRGFSVPLTEYFLCISPMVVKLYERCLIACANYSEYWIRYVLCMEASKSLDHANNALVRATQVFVKRHPEIHLFAARLKEQSGDTAGARAAYQLVHSEISPGLLEAIIKHANMERRLGNLEDAYSLFEQAIAVEKGKEHSLALPMLFAQYSRFAYLVSGNAVKAREILVEALEHVQLSKPLLEALIHFESIQSQPKQIDYLESLVLKFIEPNSETTNVASVAEREELSSIFLEFLNLFGDAQSIKKAEDHHAKLFLPHRSTTELKKRHAEDFLASDKTKLAKAYSGAPSPSAQSVMGAYPNAQNQWAAGYAAQPQAWPPASQAQGQQWNPGYTQQAAAYGGAYSAYGSSYTAPQVPAAAAVPQSAAAAAAYATYPPTYPAQQTYPQSYAQPTAAAAAATVASVQQPASATQAYYSGYY
ncbi:hypothetical protein G4B88_024630 [Cannabis sativa]|uniref:Pre-mRNA-processing factor 39 n=1 Tax=Cannabis sativa TaxID=3483 RepID=A0A7J6GWF0_CANSA|nr:hypothetical protein G4B88_024630 [Cannabis sativa]